MMSLLNRDQINHFNRDGYLMCEKLFDGEEMDLLIRTAKNDQRLEREALERRDANAGISRLWITDQLGEDIYSAVVRCLRIVEPLEQLLGGEIYHYHHKIMLKEPFVGGSWEWHQDYGYWYSNNCLFPLMGSCLIALDEASKQNGCLQVIRGSHLIGRIDHGKTGDQTGADSNRVEQALKYLDLVYCEMKPGTALFFHCNLLHRSDANHSPNPRWSLICCYNSARNPCTGRPNHPAYSYLEKWPDSKIKEIGMRQLKGIQS
ncbi:MAG: phytanoyl-CoA dioxygenase family protein [Pyrinomonadaceae bacterium]